jgi:hypothetical protein
LLLSRLFGLSLATWALVGRWFYHLTRGRASHEDIARARAFLNKLAVGWIGDNAAGIIFAGLLSVTPSGWAARPTLAPPLTVGLVTVGVGWFVAPARDGAGIAASKRPNANQIRALNILGHIVFGLGLYGSALLIRETLSNRGSQTTPHSGVRTFRP